MAVKLTIEKFHNIINDYELKFNLFSSIDSNIYSWFNNNYKNTKTKIPFECKVCGTNFEKSLVHIKLNQGCPSCSKKNRKRRTKKEIEAIKLKQNNNEKINILENILKFIKNDLGILEEYITLNKFDKLDIVIERSDKQSIGINLISLKENSFGGNIPYSHKNKYRTMTVNKTMLAEIKNINLLTIFENEFSNPFQQKIWKSIITNKLGLNPNREYARKTILKEVPNAEARLFLNENHMQQSGAMGSIKLGLYTKDTNELISLMTFGKGRYNKMPGFEMIRYCNKIGYSVVGAANKLFKNFVNNYLPDNQIIVSYANRKYAYQNKNIYKILGFKETAISEPNYFYFEEEIYNKNYPDCLKDIKLYSRVNFQKHKLKDKLKIFDPKEIEMTNMFNNNYRCVWDPGNLVYIYKKDNNHE